jgi:hypothetical protein
MKSVLNCTQFQFQYSWVILLLLCLIKMFRPIHNMLHLRIYEITSHDVQGLRIFVENLQAFKFTFLSCVKCNNIIQKFLWHLLQFYPISSVKF